MCVSVFKAICGISNFIASYITAGLCGAAPASRLSDSYRCVTNTVQPMSNVHTFNEARTFLTYFEDLLLIL